jgi:hypothetical protein
MLFNAILPLYKSDNQPIKYFLTKFCHHRFASCLRAFYGDFWSLSAARIEADEIWSCAGIDSDSKMEAGFCKKLMSIKRIPLL